jgi:hypothetical protein
MPDKRENIRIINLDSFLLMIILFFGLLAVQTTVFNITDNKNDTNPKETSVIQGNVAVCPEIQINCFQKIWIYNTGNFKLLSFDKTQFPDNKKTDQKISLLENIRKKSVKFPIPFFHYHLFPQEKDELPALS